MEEIWKDIEWFELKYQISSKWRVRSLFFWKKRILKTNVSRDITTITIWKKWFNVIRLVAQHFLLEDYNHPNIHLMSIKLNEKWEHNINTWNISLEKKKSKAKRKIYKKQKDDFLVLRYEDELKSICSRYSLLLKEEVLSDKRNKYIQQWRYECYKFLRNKWFSYLQIGKAFNKNHAAILYIMKKYKKDLQLEEKTI